MKVPALRAGVKSKPSELMKDDGHETNSAAAAAVSELMLSLVRKRKRRRTLVQWAAVLLAFEDEMAEAGREDIMPRRVYFRPDYSQSAWAIMLEAKEELSNPSSRQSKSFRRRFRLPYPVFLHLVGLVRERRWFPMRTEDVAGRKCIPLELKVSSIKAYRMNEQH